MKLTHVALLVCMVACRGANKISDFNFSGFYAPASLKPSLSVYHDSEKSSTLFVSLKRKQLLYKRDNDQPYISRLFVSCRLYPSLRSSALIDSSSVSHTDQNPEGQDDIIVSLRMNTAIPQPYSCMVTVTDLNRQVSTRTWLQFDKSKKQSREFFGVTHAGTGKQLTTPYLSSQDTVVITYDGSPAKAFIRCYHRSFPLADPPFIEKAPVQFNYAADSIMQIDFYSGIRLTFPDQGFYHIQFDTTIKQGLTLFRFEDDYPRFTNVRQLIESLRFITNQNEYEKMRLATDKKQAVDRFWIELSGSQERARTLIRKYYTRAETANFLFTTHQEGWRTDRGMIYMIFGPPASVYVNPDSEEWSYGSYGYSGTLTFQFEKIYNPFSDGDYILRRSRIYEQPWYRAVSRWREGVAEND